MKLVFMFALGVVAVVGCSSQAPDSESASTEPVVESQASPLMVRCPLQWECQQGPNTGKYYTTIGKCGLVCGGTQNCASDYNCNGHCFCP